MSKSRFSRIMIWFALSIVLVIAQALWPINPIARVQAGDPVLSKWAETTPLIDGYLRGPRDRIPAEWDDADRVDFLLSWDAESHNASLYVKNDYINLYLAFVIEDEDHDVNDRVVFNFDNDHDGVKEIGDDQLWVDMSVSFVSWDHRAGHFVDGFFPTPAEAASFEQDILSAGTLDGIGAAGFTGASPSEPGDYIVEVAHPLDTLDSGHDFSLGGGLGHGGSVGINVMYLDSGVVKDGWPTLTWGDWSQMATITLAAPPVRPPLGFGRNLKIAGIEITQAVQYWDDPLQEDNSLPLAYGKSTAVRVFVDPGIYGSTVHDVTVYLYATSVAGDSLAHAGWWSSDGPLEWTTGIQAVLPPGFFTRERPEYTVNFLLPDYWVTRGSLNLVAFVKAAEGVTETLYSDNWMEWQTISFTLTTSWRIGYYRIDYRPTATDPTPNIPSPGKEALAHKFFEKVTPMPDLSAPVNLVYLGTIIWEGPSFTYPNGTFHEENQEELIAELNERWRLLTAAGDIYDAICGLYGGNANTSIGQANGQMGNFPNVFVAHENRSWSFAHEICHNWPTIFPHSWSDPANPYFGWARVNSSQTYGYDASGIRHPQEPRDVVKVPNHLFEGRYGALMSYSRRWISPYEWAILMDAYDPPAEALSTAFRSGTESFSPGMLVTGVIHNNDTGSLHPVFQTQSFLNITPPSGPYVVELRGAPPAEPLLYSQSFAISFEPDADAEGLPPLSRTFFTLDLPYLSETYSVSLWNTTISPPVLLDKITASSTPPAVTVTYPNGGEIVGDTLNVTWTAFDPDTGGDPLTFRLFYSCDGGTTWTPISPRLTETNFTVDASDLPGSSQSLIRVLASDGFHTSEDSSNVVFTVLGKGPQGIHGYVQTAIGVEPLVTDSNVSLRSHAGSFVILRGSAFDLEDGVLQESALLWTSDLEGVLGAGNVLAVTDLRPGTHNVTLTAIDSHGNNASYSFLMVVELHNLRIAEGSAAPLETYQGRMVHINFTVVNEGNVNEPFNALVYALSGSSAQPDTLVGNQSVTDLQPDANTTLIFDWNTTEVALGNYTISCYVTPSIGELYTFDNYQAVPTVIVVKIPGDINGDNAVDIFDAVTIALAFGATPSDPHWNTTADINEDLIVDIFDLVIVAIHFGESS